MIYLATALAFLAPLLSIVLPLVLLGWALHVLRQMQNEQRQMLLLVASIEAELRARGDRERWPARRE